MYNFDEGALELPANYRDQTVHIFQNRDPGGGDTITITRDRLPEGKELPAFVDSHIAEVSSKLRRFEMLMKERATVGALPAMLFRFVWHHPEKGRVYQQQAFVDYRGKLLSLTMTSLVKDREKTTVRFDELLGTVKFRKG